MVARKSPWSTSLGFRLGDGLRGWQSRLLNGDRDQCSPRYGSGGNPSLIELEDPVRRIEVLQAVRDLDDGQPGESVFQIVSDAGLQVGVQVGRELIQHQQPWFH